MSRSTLLRIDGLVNFGLGGLLLVFPAEVVRALGIPGAESAFYPSVLGGVLIGIGLALWLEGGNRTGRSRGLGLLGAVAINLCGGAVLAGWLVFGELRIPSRGALVLWLLVAVLVGLSVVELVPARKDGAT
jgi:hypothetical protein